MHIKPRIPTVSTLFRAHRPVQHFSTVIEPNTNILRTIARVMDPVVSCRFSCVQCRSLICAQVRVRKLAQPSRRCTAERNLLDTYTEHNACTNPDLLWKGNPWLYATEMVPIALASQARKRRAVVEQQSMCMTLQRGAGRDTIQHAHEKNVTPPHNNKRTLSTCFPSVAMQRWKCR